MTDQYLPCDINMSPAINQNLLTLTSAGVGGTFRGSVNTEVTRWDQANASAAGDALSNGAITMTDSVTDGTLFTINLAGIWNIIFMWQVPAGTVGSIASRLSALALGLPSTTVPTTSLNGVGEVDFIDPAAASNRILTTSIAQSVPVNVNSDPTPLAIYFTTDTGDPVNAGACRVRIQRVGIC